MRPGDVLDSRFHLEAQAGAGAMGVVFRGRDSFTGEAVAIKVLKGDRASAARFEREAKVLAQLQHPAVVRYVAHGATASGERYLAMEWIDGEDLERRLARGPLAIPDALFVARRIADALALAHARGIVHRDLKPNNLFLPAGEPRDVKLLDFGIARVANATHGMTAAGAVIGTPGYMAPEQVRGDVALDPRADVFALGCVLFECLTGRAVFVGENILALLAKIVLEEPARVTELRADVPRLVDDLVARMLAKDREDRPADGAAARDAIAELERSLESGEAPARGGPSLVPPSITSGEMQVVSVVIAPTMPKTTPERVTEVLSSSGGSAIAVPAPGITSSEEAYAETHSASDPQALAALSMDLGRLGARFERLADGVIVATLHGSGVATDQAAQAARCALALRRAYAEAPIVLATGRGVFLGRIPVGQVIEKAVKMLRALPKDALGGAAAIHVDEVTAGLLPSRFQVRAATPFVELLREERGADLPRTLLGRTTPFVGRDADIATLLGVFAQVAGEQLPRAVVVTGAPGLGKSRLREELVARLRKQAAAPEVWVGAAEPLGSGSPLGLLARALRSAACAPNEPIDARRFVDRVSRHVAPAEVPRVSTFLAELLDVPLDGAPGFELASVQLRAARREPPLMAEQMQRAFVEFVAAECGAHPVVLVLEDAHWGDMPTMKFVDAALRELEDRSLMAIAFGRPELEDAFPSLWAERGVLRMSLAALTPRAAERLAREVLGKDVDADVVRRVVQQAGGNPFFLEELLRAVASGASGAMPETVLAIVQKRLEALDDASRRVLRAASVLGLVFWRGAASALLGGGRGVDLDRVLADLGDRELVIRRANEEWAFRHALVRDAAYNMLTDADRTLGHRLAGEWLEQSGVHDAALLAEHFERGGESARAARAYVTAAAQALRADDLDGCLRLAKRGLALDGDVGEARGPLHLACAEAHYWRAELQETRTEGADALSSLPAGSDPWCEAIALAIAACARLGRPDEADRLAADLEREAPKGTPASLLAAARSAGFLPPGPRANALLALLPDAETPGIDALLAARIDVARATHALAAGDRVHVLEHFARAANAFESAGHLRGGRAARANAGYVSAELGRLEDAEKMLRDALEGARRLRVNTTIGWALMHLGIVVARLERFEEALLHEREAFELARGQGDKQLQAEVAVATADILVAAGRPRDAIVEATRARDVDAPALRAAALAALARAHVALREADRARSAAEDAKALLDAKTGAEEVELAVRLAWAEALHASGRARDAQSAIEEAKRALLTRANDIADVADREMFLKRVPVNARILLLADTWRTTEL